MCGQKMKRIYRKEEGVSPVIATILMGAITVVLAATVYIMVAGMGGTYTNRVMGSLTYLTDPSDTDTAVFEVTLTTPSSPDVTDVTWTVINGTSTVTTGVTTTVQHITSSSDTTKIKSGDRITLEVAGEADLAGYELIIDVTGYTGTGVGKVPI